MEGFFFRNALHKANQNPYEYKHSMKYDEAPEQFHVILIVQGQWNAYQPCQCYCYLNEEVKAAAASSQNFSCSVLLDLFLYGFHEKMFN